MVWNNSQFYERGKMAISVKANSTNQANKYTLSQMCGVNDVLMLVGKRWIMAVLYEIALGSDQFSSLKKSIDGISAHLLGMRINDLVQHALIIKIPVEGTMPVQIVYTVTEKGRQLLEIVNNLNEWKRCWDSENSQES